MIRAASTARLALLFLLAASLAWAQTPPAADSASVEVVFWQSIRESRNAVDFEEYLRQYPNGRFAGLARNRIKVLASGAAVPTRGDLSAGATWKYRYRNLRDSSLDRVFTVRLQDAENNPATEIITLDDGTVLKPRQVDMKEAQFSSVPLGGKATLLEFSPYIPVMDGASIRSTRHQGGMGYPVVGTGGDDWKVDFVRPPNHTVRVPAGRYDAQRLQLKGDRSFRGVGLSNFHVYLWYAPEVKRYVRMEHRAYNTSGVILEREVIELLEYSGP